MFGDVTAKRGRVLDVGCGVGGPMRSIARASGADIVGINNNDYQVRRAEAHNRALGLDRSCTVRKGDFMALPFKPESFDAAYAIAATCHAPSLEGRYAEVRRVLKSGGRFACVECCTTARFGPDNHDHRRLREAVAAGNGLAAVLSMEEALAAARNAGFDVIEAADLAPTGGAGRHLHAGFSHADAEAIAVTGASAGSRPPVTLRVRDDQQDLRIEPRHDCTRWLGL